MSGTEPVPRVVPGPPADPRDAHAANQLDAYRVGELGRVRKGAERWSAGLAALATVLSTALVIKGPESFKALTPEASNGVLLLMVLGVSALAGSIYFSYRASAGSPSATELDKLASTQQTSHGLAGKWDAAVKSQVEDCRRSLSIAVWGTLVGVALLVAAVVVAWTGVAGDSATRTSTCIVADAGTVTIDGAAPAVTSGSLTIVPCE